MGLYETQIKKSDLPDKTRYDIFSDYVINYMDEYGLTEIPSHGLLTKSGNDQGRVKIGNTMVNFKTLFWTYMKEGEYDTFVKPLIKIKRPEFTHPFTSHKPGIKKYIVDENIYLSSLGELIVYNTFKMNGHILLYEPKDIRFKYNLDGNIVEKRPDFYWPKNKLIIEVAGLNDERKFGSKYIHKLDSAKKQIESEGNQMVILDYHRYRNSPKDFYKYVCNTFGFDYNPDNFLLTTKHQNFDESKYLEIVKNLLKKEESLNRKERYDLSNIIVNILGYDSVWQFKHETGLGLRWNDIEIRNKLKQAWCQSTGSNISMLEKFKELFPNDSMSKRTIEKSKNKFPQEFDISKKEIICGEKLQFTK